MKFRCSFLVLLMAASLAACGNGQGKKAATQVAVKVNNSEISVHQLNAVLSRVQGVKPEMATQVRQEALGRLVELQLAYDQAVTQKLDRNPDVMLAIEAAKREIVARAYLDQMVSTLPKPGETEIGKYYSEHPELFGQRKLYNLVELAVERRDDFAPEIRRMLASGSSLEQVAGWLQSRNVPFRPQQGIRPAEQIALEVLPQLATMSDGQVRLLEAPQGYLVVHLIGSRAAPMNLQAAAPVIQQFLQRQQGQKAVEAELQRLKGTAKIEYVGEFANTPPTGNSGTPAASIVAPNAADDANIGKGVAGLK
ncbi:MAG: EpsD family peptidyl-prolyl cis-trans isomerase [Zoogloeaceae bacterium]|nr:EpsD family peptidyl-prolyl cis-trans isomerase [Zoogloeaceae bacterium]